MKAHRWTQAVRWALPTLLVALLTGCGADGEPETPEFAALAALAEGAVL